jgi:serine protease Do
LGKKSSKRWQQNNNWDTAKVKLSSAIIVLLNLGLLAIAALLWLMPSKPNTKSDASTEQIATTTPVDRTINSAIAEIAQHVTVRVLTKTTMGSGAMGSGAIVQRQNRTYTVLTCDHVVAGSQSGDYTVLTADGATHPARRQLMHLAGVDLALLEFDSLKPYRVAVLGNSHALKRGDRVYASGFPNYQFFNKSRVEETRNWGNRAFRLTTGEVALVSERTLPEGYSLGYTNEVEQGMSGGPVLDRKGNLIGINGRLKYPLQGIDVFTFADGTKPSVELFHQMEALSWAIPIATFQDRAAKNLAQPQSQNEI